MSAETGLRRAEQRARRKSASRGATRRGGALPGEPRRPLLGPGARRLLGRVLLSLTALAVLGLAGLGGQRLWAQVDGQRIETVQIEGQLQHVDEREVRRALQRFMNQSLVSLRLEDVQAVLEGQPWIEEVTLRRQWPGILNVQIREQVAIGRWGSDSLLNQRGQRFQPASLRGAERLPLLNGPAGSESRVMAQYQTFTQFLNPLRLRIVALDMNSRGAWQFQLDNGVRVKVGSNKAMEKMRRLVTFLSSMGLEGLAGVETLDLRYSNGISVSRRALVPDTMVAL